MLVDPEILRAFAGQVDTASTTIREADAGNKVSTAAARLVGGHVTEQAELPLTTPGRATVTGYLMITLLVLSVTDWLRCSGVAVAPTCESALMKFEPAPPAGTHRSNSGHHPT